MKERNLRNFCFFLFLTLFVGITLGCVKFNPIETTPQSPVGIIPKGFDWKTVKEFTCTVRVSSVSGIGDNMIHVIKIFNSPLLNDGALIVSGSAKPSSPYIVKLTLPTALPKIYIQEILPNGVRNVKSVDVSATSLDITFNQIITPGASLFANSSPTPSISIPENFDVTILNNNSLDITGFSSGNGIYGNDYKSYLIPSGFNRTVSFGTNNILSHAILFVQGTLKANWPAALNNVSIVVLKGGRLEIQAITTATSNADIVTVYVENGGTLVTSSGINITNGRYIVNKGTMNLSSNLNITNGSSFFNEGSLTVTKTSVLKSILLSKNAFLYNSSYIYCDIIVISETGSVLNDKGSSFETQDWIQNISTLNNHGHIVATRKFEVNTGSVVNNFCNILSNFSDLQATLNLYDGSLFNCQTLFTSNIDINMYGGSMILTGTITGIWSTKVRSASDNYSVFKCTGDVPDMRAKFCEFSGKIELVHTLMVEGSVSNGRVLYESLFNNNGSILSKTQTKNIIASACNDAAGQIEAPPQVITDADADGVALGIDVDDNDATVAYVSYFPSANTWGTYAFEDLWPSKGDYDVNDMIIGFKVTYYSNSSNLVSGIRLDYNMRASGATFNIGAAFQLDNISAASIASVSGRNLLGSAPFSVNTNGTENGVTVAIIPLFNSQTDIVSYSGYLNTANGSYVITPDMYLRVRFTTPVQQSNLAMSTFNMFIVANDRRREVHLPTFSATSKFNTSLTIGAHLYEGDVFKYIDGMMWGLMIPESFQYPLEANTIISAYPHFAEWATSGGVSYSDWYMQKTGYINHEYIYSYDF